MLPKVKAQLKDESKKEKKKNFLSLVSSSLSTSSKGSDKKEFDEISYFISHDIQASVRNIVHFSSLLKEVLKEKRNSRIDKYLTFIKDASETANEQLNVLKDYILMDQVQKKEMSSEDVLQALNGSLLLLKDVIQLRKVKIKVPCHCPAVKSDKEKLKTVFYHLIDNAIKFTEEGISPTVSISTHKEGEDFVKFCVKDNGIGIGSDFFEKIFILFKRLHAGDEYKGVGAGLSLVKKMVELNGGRVSLTSQEGEGSSFFFTLPSAS